MRDKHEDQHVRYLVPLLIALAVSLLLSLCTLLAFAALISGGVWKQDMMRFASGTACLLGAFVMGIRGISVSKGKKALLVGLASGFGYFMTLFLLGSLMFLRWFPASPVISMLLTGLTGGLAAGLLGAFKGGGRSRS